MAVDTEGLPAVAAVGPTDPGGLDRAGFRGVGACPGRGYGSNGDQAATAAPPGDAGGDGADSGGSAGTAAPGRSSQAANTQAWRQAGMRARRAGYYAQQTFRALSNDGGGHAGGGPPLHMG
jgi:hypothetical protein